MVTLSVCLSEHCYIKSGTKINCPHFVISERGGGGLHCPGGLQFFGIDHWTLTCESSHGFESDSSQCVKVQ